MTAVQIFRSGEVIVWFLATGTSPVWTRGSAWQIRAAGPAAASTSETTHVLRARSSPEVMGRSRL